MAEYLIVPQEIRFTKPTVVVLLLLTVGVVGCSNSAIDHYKAGNQLANDGRWEEAIAEYDGTIRLDPQYADNFYNRGKAYSDLGEHQRAIQDYDETIRLDPQLAKVFAKLELGFIARWFRS